ncbi:MAG: hypothetical protein NZM00_07665 [Anaerolinea sp.]|nr:hypothetical protein [Anaerolinea sp.]
MSLSRRDFLQVIGLSLGAGVAHHILSNPGFAQISPESQVGSNCLSPIGRVLYPAPVRSVHNRHAVVRTVWEDEIIPIQPTVDQNWLATADGLIAAEAVHALNPQYQYPSPGDAVPPYPAEVCAGSASVYAWCSASAPLMTRIGGGGAAWIVDQLSIGGINWVALAVSPHDAIIGWSNARLWRPILWQREEHLRVDHLVIDQTSHVLTAYHEHRISLQTRIAQAARLHPGTYQVNFSAVCASEKYQIQTQPFASGLIVPYVIHFGDSRVAGAYWHNRFGWNAPGLVPDGLVTIHPYAARLLYAAVTTGTSVIVT